MAYKEIEKKVWVITSSGKVSPFESIPAKRRDEEIKYWTREGCLTWQRGYAGMQGVADEK